MLHASAVTQPPQPVWVAISTTQEVVAVGLRTILENAMGPFEITTAGPAGDEPTWSCTTSST